MTEGKVCRQIIMEDARGYLWQRSLPVVVERLTDLDSSQEEADTRLLLHSARAARSSLLR